VRRLGIAEELRIANAPKSRPRLRVVSRRDLRTVPGPGPSKDTNRRLAHANADGAARVRASLETRPLRCGCLGWSSGVRHVVDGDAPRTGAGDRRIRALLDR